MLARSCRQASVDHVVPRSKGGTNATSNLITCCMPCNAKRGHRTVPVFAALLELISPGRPEMHEDLVQRRVRAAQRRKLPQIELKVA